MSTGTRIVHQSRPIATFQSDLLLFLLVALALISTSSSFVFGFSHSKLSSRRRNTSTMAIKRRSFINLPACLALLTLSPSVSRAFSNQPSRVRTSDVSYDTNIGAATSTDPPVSSVAYKVFSLPIPEFPGTSVPVACWFPVEEEVANTASQSTTYQYRISVRRIGQLLPNWDFIPAFVAKDFTLPPTNSAAVVDGRGILIPSQRPTLVLAHGYLGSRFDLSHLAEDLASAGYVCIAPEYPESLSASYERQQGLDRRLINQQLLSTLTDTMGVVGSSYGVMGHSLGCGTVAELGDSSWTRVSIAGSAPRKEDTTTKTKGLQIASLNDGLVRMREGKVEDYTDAAYTLVDTTTTAATSDAKLPKRAALVLDQPNHISFLCEGVNDAMIDFLSPMLPIAKALSIPVLDFDRYQESRDSKATAAVVLPVIKQYLKQEMI